MLNEYQNTQNRTAILAKALMDNRLFLLNLLDSKLLTQKLNSMGEGNLSGVLESFKQSYRDTLASQKFSFVKALKEENLSDLKKILDNHGSILEHAQANHMHDTMLKIDVNDAFKRHNRTYTWESILATPKKNSPSSQ